MDDENKYEQEFFIEEFELRGGDETRHIATVADWIGREQHLQDWQMQNLENLQGRIDRMNELSDAEWDAVPTDMRILFLDIGPHAINDATFDWLLKDSIKHVTGQEAEDLSDLGKDRLDEDALAEDIREWMARDRVTKSKKRQFTRVLIALGQETHDSWKPMKAAQAERIARRAGQADQWSRIVEVLRAREAA